MDEKSDYSRIGARFDNRMEKCPTVVELSIDLCGIKASRDIIQGRLRHFVGMQKVRAICQRCAAGHRDASCNSEDAAK